MLRRLWYAGVVLGRVLRPYAATLAVAIVLLGVIGWMSYQLWGPKAASATFQRADSLPPAPAVETFLKGQQDYNADLMWEAYSSDYQDAQLANGTSSKEKLQALANIVKKQEIQFVHSDYIGGVQIEDGGSRYFYNLDLAQGNVHRHFPYVFTADADGKIVDVDSPFLRPPSSAK
jgi:hypothetical protein